MPHNRVRFGLQRIIEKLKYSPVTAIQGARQVGKSFIARELIPAKLKNTRYITFDESAVKKFALTSPDTFLAEQDEFSTIIIDEAQKVPEIFDAIKLSVDKRKRPGKFLLLGSTEFSTEMNIKESLTGRLSKAILYPLTIAESQQLKPEYRILSLNNITTSRIERSEFLKSMNRGGLPGIFSIREESERQNLLNDWIKLLVTRDIFQFKRLRLDSDISYEILSSLAKNEVTDINSISKHIKIPTKKVETHIKALKQLFVINSLKPHPLGAGKERFFIFDSGIANYLGCSFRKKLEIVFLNEILTSFEYQNIFPYKISTYITSRGSVIDFILEFNNRKIAIKIIDKEDFDKRDYKILEALKLKSSDFELYTIGATDLKVGNVKQVSWERVI